MVIATSEQEVIKNEVVEWNTWVIIQEVTWLENINILKVIYQWKSEQNMKNIESKF